MSGNEEIRDHTTHAHEVRVKAAQREVLEAERRHSARLTTLFILVLIVASVQTLALMHVASRMTIVVIPPETRASAPAKRAQTLYFRGGSADCGVSPGKTPAAAGDFIHGGRERGSL